MPKSAELLLKMYERQSLKICAFPPHYGTDAIIYNKIKKLIEEPLSYPNQAANAEGVRAGGAMEDHLNSKGICSVCKEGLTTIHAEVAPGSFVFVCEKCLETAKQNFIWICIHCGKVYIRPKATVLRRLNDPGLKKAYYLCEDLQIIQGIDYCVECAPEEIMAIMATAKSQKNGGHC